jgi:hypothetical protein
MSIVPEILDSAAGTGQSSGLLPRFSGRLMLNQDQPP